MLPGVRSLRNMLHATAVEVLFALTPRHLQNMLDSLVSFLNAQHAKFLARHPAFKVGAWLAAGIAAGITLTGYSEGKGWAMALQICMAMVACIPVDGWSCTCLMLTSL